MSKVVNFTAATNETTQATMSKERLFNLTMQNRQRIGNKEYVCIAKELLFTDMSFQRVEESSKTKIRALANKWDENQMDALKVSVHPETFDFSIIDGYHRFTAGTMKGIEEFPCVLLQGLSSDPKERLVQEATLFATQGDEIDTLSPVEKHKANVLRGVKENVILQEIVDKYNIPLKKNPSHGRVTVGHLAGYTQALAVAKVHGKELLDDVFYTICEARWNLAQKGLSANVISPIANMFKFHPEHREEIKKELIEYFKPIEPDRFFASAMEKYPERKEKERLAVFLEDILCDKIGMERTYKNSKTK